MNKAIDYGITCLIFAVTLLIAFALAGASSGQDKPPQAPPVEPDSERQQRYENEREEALKELDFTPLKGAIDEDYDKPDPVKVAPRFASREALRAAVWKDKTVPFTPKLPKVENDLSVARARAIKEKKGLAWWLGEDSANSKEGFLLLEEIGDKMVHVYLRDDVNPANNKHMPAVKIRTADGGDRLVRMANCSSETSAKLMANVATEDQLPNPGKAAKATPPPQLRAAPTVIMQAAPVRAPIRIAAPPARVAAPPVRRGG